VTNVSTLAPAALLVAVGQRVIWSALFTLLADISVPEERDCWYGLSAAQSAGFGAGGLLSGLVVAAGGVKGYHLAFTTNAVSFFLSALLLLLRVPEPTRTSGGLRRENSYSVVLQDRPFALMVAKRCTVHGSEKVYRAASCMRTSGNEPSTHSGE